MCTCIVTALHCALFGRRRDVECCSIAPEEFSPTSFLALFFFPGCEHVCPCVCARACVCALVCVCVCVCQSTSTKRGAGGVMKTPAQSKARSAIQGHDPTILPGGPPTGSTCHHLLPIYANQKFWSCRFSSGITRRTAACCVGSRSMVLRRWHRRCLCHRMNPSPRPNGQP